MDKLNILERKKLEEQLQKKLNVIRYDLLTKGFSELSLDFFKVSIPVDSSNKVYSLVDLTSIFPQELDSFLRDHEMQMKKLTEKILICNKKLYF